MRVRNELAGGSERHRRRRDQRRVRLRELRAEHALDHELDGDVERRDHRQRQQDAQRHGPPRLLHFTAGGKRAFDAHEREEQQRRGLGNPGGRRHGRPTKVVAVHEERAAEHERDQRQRLDRRAQLGEPAPPARTPRALMMTSVGVQARPESRLARLCCAASVSMRRACRRAGWRPRRSTARNWRTRATSPQSIRPAVRTLRPHTRRARRRGPRGCRLPRGTDPAARRSPRRRDTRGWPEGREWRQLVPGDRRCRSRR